MDFLRKRTLCLCFYLSFNMVYIYCVEPLISVVVEFILRIYRIIVNQALVALGLTATGLVATAAGLVAGAILVAALVGAGAFFGSSFLGA